MMFVRRRSPCSGRVVFAVSARKLRSTKAKQCRNSKLGSPVSCFSMCPEGTARALWPQQHGTQSLTQEAVLQFGSAQALWIKTSCLAPPLLCTGRLLQGCRPLPDRLLSACQGSNGSGNHNMHRQVSAASSALTRLCIAVRLDETTRIRSRTLVKRWRYQYLLSAGEKAGRWAPVLPDAGTDIGQKPRTSRLCATSSFNATFMLHSFRTPETGNQAAAC